MISDQIVTILDFYTKCNNPTNDNDNLTKGEKTILECVSIYGLKSQIGLPFDENKAIRMLFAKDLSEEHLNLKNKEEFDKLKIEYYDSIERRHNNKPISLEASMATSCADVAGKVDERTFVSRDEIFDLYQYFNSLRNIKINEKESLLDHIYYSCLLAYGIESEYKYCVDFNKIIKLIIFGRLDDFSLLDKFKDKDEYIKLLKELREKSTLESEYAYLCDKTECDMQQKSSEVNNEYNRIPCFKSMLLTYKGAI